MPKDLFVGSEKERKKTLNQTKNKIIFLPGYGLKRTKKHKQKTTTMMTTIFMIMMTMRECFGGYSDDSDPWRT